MTYQNDFTLSETLLEQLTTSGLEALPTLFQVLLNAAMQIERQKHLGAAPHERTEQRNGHANGFKDKTLHKPTATGSNIAVIMRGNRMNLSQAEQGQPAATPNKLQWRSRCLCEHKALRAIWMPVTNGCVKAASCRCPNRRRCRCERQRTGGLGGPLRA